MRAVGKPRHPGSPDRVYLVMLTLRLELAVTNLHPSDKGFMVRKTGVWWAHDKSADDDG